MTFRRLVWQVDALLITLLLAASAVRGSDKVRITSALADSIITVDGRAGDWPETALRYFPDEEAVMGVAHDSTSLYLMVRFRDEKWVRAVSMAGFKWEFESKGDSAQKVTLVFRGGTPSQARDSGGMRPRGGESALPEGRGPMLGPGDRRTFTCAIKDRIEEKEIPVDGAEGPAAAFAIDQGLYTYEFSIPRAKGAVRYYGLGISQEDRLTVKATWGDMIEMRRGMSGPGGRPEGGMGAPPGGGIPGGMGGGMGGGMPPGGGPGGGMGSRPDMPEKHEVTLQIDFGEKKK
jgi:hypothetical protein